MTDDALYVDVTGKTRKEIQRITFRKLREGYVLYSLRGAIPKVEKDGNDFQKIAPRWSIFVYEKIKHLITFRDKTRKHN